MFVTLDFAHNAIEIVACMHTYTGFIHSHVVHLLHMAQSKVLSLLLGHFSLWFKAYFWSCVRCEEQKV